MSSKNLYQKYSSKVKNTYFFRTIKRLLFEQSHLAPYLPFMKQALPKKIIRLHQDQSYKVTQIDENSSHQKQHKNEQADKQFLFSLFFTSKQCYNPIGNWLLIWYVFVFLAIIYSYVEMGIILIYGQQAWADLNSNPATIGITSYCILVFIVDIVVQFNSGYLSRGVIVTEKRRVVSKYLRSYFVPDVLLVVVLLAALISSDFYINLIKIISVLKLMRMFEFDDLYLRRIAVNKLVKVNYVIWKQFITIFILAHTIGIVFYAVDYALTNDPICLQNNSLCWLYSATTYSPIMNYDWNIRYFYSVYWGINTMTTISYGDIAPNNPYQTVYAVFFFCFGFIVYGYVVNNIIRVILWARQAADNYKHQIIIYTTYMDNLKIDKKVQYQVRDFFQTHYFQQNQRSNQLEQQMKSRLPQDLKDQLLINAYSLVHNQLGYYLASSPSIPKLLYYIQQAKFSEGESVLGQGSVVTKLWYLFKGQVELTCTFGRKVQYITNINIPDTFLSHYQFFVNQRATYNMTVTKTTTLYFINKTHIDQQLAKYTDLKENFKLLQYQLRHEYLYKKIFYRCHFCRLDHHWYECVDLFPLFKNVNLAKYSQVVEKSRFLRVAHKTWKDKSKLKMLQKINKQPQFMLLQKMQERIYNLKKMKKDMLNSFDVDVGYDWQYYLPTFNLSIFKLEWKKEQSKKQSSNNFNKEQLKRLFTLSHHFQ